MQFLKIPFLLILLFSTAFASVPEQPIVVRVGGYEFAPFIEKEGKEGIVKDLIEKLNTTQNKYHFEFVLTSANRRYRDFKAQKYDVILFEDEAWSWKDSKMTYGKTEVLANGGEMAVALNDGLRTQNYFDDLSSKKIEVVLGYHYRIADMKVDAQSLTKKGIIQGKSYESNLADLMSNKVDVTFINSLMLTRYLNKNKELKDKFLIRQKMDHQFALRALIHPNSPIKVSELEKLGFNKVMVSDETN